MENVTSKYIDMILEDFDDEIKSKFLKSKTSFMLFNAMPLLTLKNDINTLIDYSKESGLPDFEKCLSYFTESEIKHLSVNLVQPFIHKLKSRDRSFDVVEFMRDTSKVLLYMIYNKISTDYKIPNEFKSKMDEIIPNAIELGHIYIKHSLKL